MSDWPPKRSFQPPRYPNVWICVSEEIADTYRKAAAFVQQSLAHYVGLVDDLPPSKGLECADAQARLAHVQPVTGLPDSDRDHHHDLHIRYYFSHLPPRNQHRTRANMGNQTLSFWRLPASVHYEVEDDHPGHPYIDECPVCGVVPPYDLPGDRCEVSHDPLGLELLFYGTVRGETIYRNDDHPAGGLQTMAEDYHVQLSLFEPANPEMNTLRVGLVQIAARQPG